MLLTPSGPAGGARSTRTGRRYLVVVPPDGVQDGSHRGVGRARLGSVRHGDPVLPLRVGQIGQALWRLRLVLYTIPIGSAWIVLLGYAGPLRACAHFQRGGLPLAGL